MSRSAEIRLEFAGEERLFRFGLGEHKRLQEALDCGVSVVVQRLHAYATATRAGATIGQFMDAGLLGDIRIEQIGEVILQGLIGGGMTPNDAGRLRRSYVDARPPLENAVTAYAVGLAALSGVEDEQPSGEQKGRVRRPSRTEKSGSGETGSTPSAEPQVTRRKT